MFAWLTVGRVENRILSECIWHRSNYSVFIDGLELSLLLADLEKGSRLAEIKTHGLLSPRYYEGHGHTNPFVGSYLSCP